MLTIASKLLRQPYTGTNIKLVFEFCVAGHLAMHTCCFCCSLTRIDIAIVCNCCGVSCEYSSDELRVCKICANCCCCLSTIHVNLYTLYQCDDNLELPTPWTACHESRQLQYHSAISLVTQQWAVRVESNLPWSVIKIPTNSSHTNSQAQKYIALKSGFWRWETHLWATPLRK